MSERQIKLLTIEKKCNWTILWTILSIWLIEKSNKIFYSGFNSKCFENKLNKPYIIWKCCSIQNWRFLPFVNSKLGSQVIVRAKWGPNVDFWVFLSNLIIENWPISTIIWQFSFYFPSLSVHFQWITIDITEVHTKTTISYTIYG